MIVAANDYLDARRPAWLDAEHAGRVVYDTRTRIVRIEATAEDISAALEAATVRETPTTRRTR